MLKISSMFEKGLGFGSPYVNLDELRRARRIERVRSMWRNLVDPIFLEHTNSVFVFDKDGSREMHVYVDDSIFAAELNAQREIIKWRCLEEYGEQIEDFFIHVSKGRYKSVYPFRHSGGNALADTQPTPLTDADMAMIAQNCEKIADSRLREAFRTAMTNDLRRSK